MTKILWIDDNLSQDLTDIRMSLIMEDDFDTHFARDATEARNLLLKESFDVIIFDLRLPAGADDFWNERRAQREEKYGRVLLKMIRGNEDGQFSHLKDAKIGVFTIEPKEANKDLFETPILLKPANFAMKTHTFYEDDFIQFIRNVSAS